MNRLLRQQITREVYSLFLKGYSNTAIADQVGRSREFVSQLIEEENERRHDEHDAGYEDREAIEFYRSRIKVAQDALDALARPNSYNIPALLNVQLRAHERIDKITGVESPTKHQNVGDFEINWPDLEPSDFDLEPSENDVDSD